LTPKKKLKISRNLATKNPPKFFFKKKINSPFQKKKKKENAKIIIF